MEGTMQKQPSRGVLRKGVLKICCKVTGEHSCRSVILIKLLCNFIEIILRHECSPVNLLHIFRTSFPKNTSTAASEYVIKDWQYMSSVNVCYLAHFFIAFSKFLKIISLTPFCLIFNFLLIKNHANFYSLDYFKKPYGNYMSCCIVPQLFLSMKKEMK